MWVYHSFPAGILTDLSFTIKVLGLDLFLHFFSCFILLPFIVFSSLPTDHSRFLSESKLDPFLLFLTSHLLSLSCQLPPTCQDPHNYMFPENSGSSPLQLYIDSSAPIYCHQQPCSPGYEARVLADVGVHIYRIFFSLSTYLYLQILLFFLRVQCLRSDISSPFPLMQNNKNNNRTQDTGHFLSSRIIIPLMLVFIDFHPHKHPLSLTKSLHISNTQNRGRSLRVRHKVGDVSIGGVGNPTW